MARPEPNRTQVFGERMLQSWGAAHATFTQGISAKEHNVRACARLMVTHARRYFPLLVTREKTPALEALEVRYHRQLNRLMAKDPDVTGASPRRAQVLKRIESKISNLLARGARGPADTIATQIEAYHDSRAGAFNATIAVREIHDTHTLLDSGWAPLAAPIVKSAASSDRDTHAERAIQTAIATVPAPEGNSVVQRELTRYRLELAREASKLARAKSPEQITSAERAIQLKRAQTAYFMSNQKFVQYADATAGLARAVAHGVRRHWNAQSN